MKNDASPNEKKRYLSSTACAYMRITSSREENALISIKSVDSGKWKFVISASTALNL